MKNIKTPRTLAECSFPVGYAEVSLEDRMDKILGVLLACAIGIGFGICLVVWWS